MTLTSLSPKVIYLRSGVEISFSRPIHIVSRLYYVLSRYRQTAQLVPEVSDLLTWKPRHSTHIFIFPAQVCEKDPRNEVEISPSSIVCPLGPFGIPSKADHASIAGLVHHHDTLNVLFARPMIGYMILVSSSTGKLSTLLPPQNGNVIIADVNECTSGPSRLGIAAT